MPFSIEARWIGGQTSKPEPSTPPRTTPSHHNERVQNGFLIPLRISPPTLKSQAAILQTLSWIFEDCHKNIQSFGAKATSVKSLRPVSIGAELRIALDNSNTIMSM
jgi:hypothetical protein